MLKWFRKVWFRVPNGCYCFFLEATCVSKQRLWPFKIKDGVINTTEPVYSQSRLRNRLIYYSKARESHSICVYPSSGSARNPKTCDCLKRCQVECFFVQSITKTWICQLLQFRVHGIVLESHKSFLHLQRLQRNTRNLPLVNKSQEVGVWAYAAEWNPKSAFLAIAEDFGE